MPRVSVRLPEPLRQFADGNASVSAEGNTIAEVLADLGRRYPGSGERICTPTGGVRDLVNIFLDGEDVRALDGLGTPVAEGQVISIIAAVSGG